MPFQIIQSLFSDFFYKSGLKIVGLQLGNYNGHWANILHLPIWCKEELVCQITAKSKKVRPGRFLKLNNLTRNEPMLKYKFSESFSKKFCSSLRRDRYQTKTKRHEHLFDPTIIRNRILMHIANKLWHKK